MVTIVEIAAVQITQKVSIVVTSASSITDAQLSGVKGGIRHALLCKRNLDQVIRLLLATLMLTGRRGVHLAPVTCRTRASSPWQQLENSYQ